MPSVNLVVLLMEGVLVTERIGLMMIHVKTPIRVIVIDVITIIPLIPMMKGVVGGGGGGAAAASSSC